ncbi:MAG: hypothetical protein LV480_03920 [Methylacidiphilales bacterium]|nr:hypothetical protein [Candidatus Methylacidiphilales bacterium]
MPPILVFDFLLAAEGAFRAQPCGSIRRGFDGAFHESPKAVREILEPFEHVSFLLCG